MYIVNFLLRAASVLILFVLIHQLFFSKSGIPRHRIFGKIAMILGIIIFVTIAIRGYYKETAMTWIYALHLASGFPFFFVLFRTGYLGYKSQTDAKYVRSHRRYARVTLLLLIATLVIGIISFFSHH